MPVESLGADGMQSHVGHVGSDAACHLLLAQEDNETMLAYFFLWRGLQNPTPLSKLQLDQAVEKYLQSLVM